MFILISFLSLERRMEIVKGLVTLFLYVSTSWIWVTSRFCELQHVVSAIYFHTFGAFLYKKYPTLEYLNFSIFLRKIDKFCVVLCRQHGPAQLPSRLRDKEKWAGASEHASKLRRTTTICQKVSTSLHLQSLNATEWTLYKWKAQIWTFQIQGRSFKE